MLTLFGVLLLALAAANRLVARLSAQSLPAAQDEMLKSVALPDPLDEADREAIHRGNDIPRALSVYQQASPTSPRANQRLGYLYSHGIGVVADDQRALSYYRRAADAGDRLAMNNLGHAYEAGLGVETDFADARAWYGRAAQLGEPRAMTNLGYLCSHGLGCPRSAAQAMDWYRKAAALGEPVAAYNLGRLLSRPELNSDQRNTERAFHDGLEHGDPLCEFGSSLSGLFTPGGVQTPAAAQLRNVLQYAIGLQDRVAWRFSAEQDAALTQRFIWNETELKLLREAARQGDAPAMRHLAEAAAVKDGDMASAMTLYQNAATRDDVQSMRVIAHAYATGSVLPKGLPQAIAWYQRSADAGQREAYSAMGELCESEPAGAPADAAKRYYTQGADAGDAASHYRLSKLLEGSGGRELSMDSPLLRRASTSDLAAILYEMGKDNQAARATSSRTTATTFYEQSAEAGNVWALIRLGDLYTAGQTVKHDDVQALEYYTRAARMGPRWASAVAIKLSLSDNRTVSQRFRSFIGAQLAQGGAHEAVTPATSPATAP